MLKITIKSTLKNTEKKIDKKIVALNQAIHQSGLLLETAIKQDIASYPSVDTGRFLGSIESDLSKPLQASVFTRVKYAKFLEYGTSPHFILPKTKKVLAWKGGGKWFFSKGHMVRGIKPRRHFGRTANKMAPIIRAYIEGKMKEVV